MSRAFGRLMTPGLILLIGGCANSLWDLHAPGTVQQQRLRATVHDPYSDQEAGPEVDGGRPRDYMKALPEPVRNRIYADSWWPR
jgi:hypothetical protein